MLLLYVIGIPLMAFTILYKNRSRLDKPEVLKYIILLYQGLKHSRYYWELVNTLRKSILLALHTFIPDELRIMKALIGCLVMFVISIIQLRIKPFKIEIISTLEHREMISSLLTLYGGLIFAQDDHSLQVLSVIFFIVIMLANARFMVLWVFCVTAVYKKYKYVEILNLWIKRAFCLDVTDDDENFLSYRSKVTSEGHNSKSKVSHPTVTVAKHTTHNMNILTSKPIIKKQRGTFQIGRGVRDYENIQNLEDSQATIRTPKKLISSDRNDFAISSNRILKHPQAKVLKRTKKKKKSKPEIEETHNISFDDSKTIDFFGQKFHHNDLHSKMGGDVQPEEAGTRKSSADVNNPNHITLYKTEKSHFKAKKSVQLKIVSSQEGSDCSPKKARKGP